MIDVKATKETKFQHLDKSVLWGETQVDIMDLVILKVVVEEKKESVISFSNLRSSLVKRNKKNISSKLKARRIRNV